MLVERYGAKVSLVRRKANTSLPADGPLIEDLAAGIDLALVGTGD